MKTFSISIFDGQYTRFYTTEDKNIYLAENKVIKYHMSFGYKVVKVSSVEIR